MSRLLLALALYVGLALFFAVNALALVRGASVLTALGKGLVALVLFAALGTVAGLMSRVKCSGVEAMEDVRDVATSEEA